MRTKWLVIALVAVALTACKGKQSDEEKNSTDGAVTAPAQTAPAQPTMPAKPMVPAKPAEKNTLPDNTADQQKPKSDTSSALENKQQLAENTTPDSSAAGVTNFDANQSAQPATATMPAKPAAAPAQPAEAATMPAQPVATPAQPAATMPAQPAATPAQPAEAATMPAQPAEAATMPAQPAEAATMPAQPATDANSQPAQ